MAIKHIMHRQPFVTFCVTAEFLWLTVIFALLWPGQGNLSSSVDISQNIAINMKDISYVAWNMRSFSSGLTYLKGLMGTADFVAISEHGLFNCQLWKLNEVSTQFCVTAKACKTLCDERCGVTFGHSGVALFWRASLSQYVRPLNNIQSDRICAVELTIPGTRSIVVCGVYLPHKASSIANYTEELSELDELIDEMYTRDCGIVLLGDLNAHFGWEFSSRCWGVTSQNGAEFINFSDRNNLHIVDISDKAYGPVYTFQSRTHHAGQSYIDHCVVSDNLKADVVKCYVHEECVTNLSDHLPVGMVMSIIVQEFSSVTTLDMPEVNPKVFWGKLTNQDIYDHYTLPLDAEVASIIDRYDTEKTSNVSCLKDRKSLDKFVDDIKKAMLTASASLPRRRKKTSHLKPYWSAELTVLTKKQKAVWRQWVQEGRPRHQDNNTWNLYKQAKKDFRRAQRQTEQNYVFSQIDRLCKESELDQRGFWYIVNKARKPRQAKITPVRAASGDVLTNPEAIADDWRLYYENLFQDVGPGQGYDDQFHENVMNSMQRLEVESYTRPPDITKYLVTEEEVYNIYQTLKNRKAPGPDGITNEHLKNSGPLAVKAVTIMLNSMITLEHIPNCFKLGTICPIPKGVGKDFSKKENSRPITLLSCLYKLFEKFLLNRFDRWLRARGIMSGMQGACLPGLSSSDVVALLQETVAHHRQLGSTVYVVLLDVAKAFDSVWSDGLLYKLYNIGVEGRFWRIIKSCYEDFRCNVLVNNARSSELKVKRGVHQGAPLSMRLFQVYNNDLLTELTQLKGSVAIADIKTGNPAFADDLAIVALFKRCMNDMLNASYRHSRLWRYDFNAKKSQSMIFGKDVAPEQKLKLGGVEIPFVEGTKHMGVPLCSNKVALRSLISKRCEEVKRETRVMMSIGNAHAPLPPVIGSKIFLTACLPKLVYGLETCSIDDSVCLLELGKTQIHCAKKIQGLPQQTPNPVPNATLGWNSICAVIDMAKMLFLYRWLSQPTTCVYKQVAIVRLVYFIFANTSNHQGPLYEAYETFKRYGVDYMILDVLESGSTVALKEFKRLIKNVVSEREHGKWVATLPLYKSLIYFKVCLPRSCMCVWWQVSRRVPHLTRATRIIVKLLSGQHCLASNPGVGRNSRHCSLCTSYEAETLPHFLCSCSSFAVTRQRLMNHVFEVMPLPMRQYINELNEVDRTCFVLSGFNVTFTFEWLRLYEAVSNLVYGLYLERLSAEN